MSFGTLPPKNLPSLVVSSTSTCRMLAPLQFSSHEIYFKICYLSNKSNHTCCVISGYMFLSIFLWNLGCWIADLLSCGDCHGLLVKEGKVLWRAKVVKGETSALPHSPCLYFTLLGQLDDLKDYLFMWFQLQTLI